MICFNTNLYNDTQCHDPLQKLGYVSLQLCNYTLTETDILECSEKCKALVVFLYIHVLLWDKTLVKISTKHAGFMFDYVCC